MADQAGYVIAFWIIGSFALAALITLFWGIACLVVRRRKESRAHDAGARCSHGLLRLGPVKCEPCRENLAREFAEAEKAKKLPDDPWVLKPPGPDDEVVSGSWLKAEDVLDKAGIARVPWGTPPMNKVFNAWAKRPEKVDVLFTKECEIKFDHKDLDTAFEKAMERAERYMELRKRPASLQENVKRAIMYLVDHDGQPMYDEAMAGALAKLISDGAIANDLTIAGRHGVNAPLDLDQGRAMIADILKRMGYPIVVGESAEVYDSRGKISVTFHAKKEEPAQKKLVLGQWVRVNTGALANLHQLRSFERTWEAWTGFGSSCLFQESELEPAYPKKGEVWRWMHQGGCDLCHARVQQDCTIGSDQPGLEKYVRKGCIAPVNFGKGKA